MPQENRNQDEDQAVQQAALYGPAAQYSEYHKGDTITFCSADTQNRKLTGEILYMLAPGKTIGGHSHPTTYVVFVPEESFIRAVYPGDVLQPED